MACLICEFPASIGYPCGRSDFQDNPRPWQSLLHRSISDQTALCAKLAICLEKHARLFQSHHILQGELWSESLPAQRASRPTKIRRGYRQLVCVYSNQISLHLDRILSTCHELETKSQWNALLQPPIRTATNLLTQPNLKRICPDAEQLPAQLKGNQNRICTCLSTSAGGEFLTVWITD